MIIREQYQKTNSDLPVTKKHLLIGGWQLLNRLINALLQFSDSLFGVRTYDAKLNRNQVLRYFGVALLLGVIQIARKPDSIFYAQFFAEDGSVFFREGYVFGFWNQIFTLYYGFPYLLQRLVALSFSPFSLGAAPTLYAVTAVILVALLAASFCLPYFKHIIQNDWLRIVVCILIVVLPDSKILISCLSNVTWYLAIWAMLVSFIWVPRSIKVIGALSLVSFLSAFTAPITILMAPIWVVRGVRAVLQKNFRELILAVVVVSSEIAVFIITKNLGSQTKGTFDIAAFGNIAATRIFSQAAVGTEVTKGINIFQNLFVVHLISFIVLVGFLALLLNAKLKPLAITLFTLYIIFCSITLLLLGRSEDGWQKVWSQVGQIPSVPLDYYFIAGRYFVMSILMLYIIFFAAAAQIQQQKLRCGIFGFLICVNLFAIVQSFEVASYPDKHWQDYTAQLYTKLSTHNTQPLSIPIHPQGYAINFDFYTIMPEVKVPTEARMPELTGETEYVQTFQSQCANMGQIDLYLTTFGRTNQVNFIFRLKDQYNNKLLERQIFNAQSLKDNSWLSINFEPYKNSFGARYIISIVSPEATPGSAISIWSSNKSSYFYGEAMVDGKPVDKDLVFRYGCNLELK